MTTIKQRALSSAFFSLLAFNSASTQAQNYGQDLGQQDNLGAQDAYQQASDEDLFVSVGRNGFANISEFLTAKFSRGTQNQALADDSMNIGRRLDVRLKGVTASVDLERVDLVPGNGALHVAAVVRRVDVNIGRLEVNKLGKGHKLRSGHSLIACDDTRISLGQSQALELNAALGLDVDGAGGLKVVAQDFSLPIEKHQYQAFGPRHCKGPLGRHDRLTTKIVGKVLSQAHIVLEEVVKQKVQEMLPDINRQVNQRAFGQNMAISILGYGKAPSVRLQVQATPRAVQLSEEGLRLSLSANLGSFERINDRAVEEVTAGRQNYHLATVGVKQSLIDRTLQNLIMQRANQEFEVTPDLDPRVADFLKVETLVGFWPDLELIKPEDESTRLFVSLPESPVLTAGTDNVLKVDINNATLRFQVKLQGAWQDYFLMKAKFGLTVQTSLTMGKLELAFRDPEVATSGSFASGYQPKDPTFDAEAANETLLTVLKIGVRNFSPLQLQIPGPKLSDGGVTFDGLSYEDDTLLMGVIGYTTPAPAYANYPVANRQPRRAPYVTNYATNYQGPAPRLSKRH